MDPYKELRFCSNCSTLGSLKYVSHKEGGEYVCRKCWADIEAVKRRMGVPDPPKYHYESVYDIIWDDIDKAI